LGIRHLFVLAETRNNLILTNSHVTMQAKKPDLFGTSGIRGVINIDFEPALTIRLGMALASVLKEGMVTLARDTRTSGEMLSSAFTAGTLAGGLEVTNLGILPTPVLAYLTNSLGAATGAMITASHNPPEFNGIKLFDRYGKAYDDALQTQIEHALGGEKQPRASWYLLGEMSSADYSYRYVETILSRIELERAWKVAVDFGSGAAYQIAFDLLRSLRCHLVSLNAQPDGAFPGRSPEPTSESLSALMTTVRDMNCDIGFAYDGDADRVFLVDETGQGVEGDVALAAFASYMVRKQGKGGVALPVDTSLAVQEAVEENGGKVIWTKVGDANVAEAIVRKKAIFGGEPCGAWIHPDFHLCPDGILSCILLLKALEEQGMTVRRFCSGIKRYPVKRGKIPCENRVKIEIMSNIASNLPKALGKKTEITRIDGIRVRTPTGWVLVRASGTEPAVRVTVEARSTRLAEDLFNVTCNLCSNIARENLS